MNLNGMDMWLLEGRWTKKNIVETTTTKLLASGGKRKTNSRCEGRRCSKVEEGVDYQHPVGHTRQGLENGDCDYKRLWKENMADS